MASPAHHVTYDLSLLRRSAERWRVSAGLRAYYHDLLRDVLRHAPAGPKLELGSGIGAIREIDDSVVTSDVAPTPYVQRVVSAYAIEEAGRDWSAVLATDVLHHLCEPLRFLASAAENLRPGGRIVLAEPAATPLGRLFYRCCHREPCRHEELDTPWRFEADRTTNEFANMGMAWALFVRERPAVERQLASLGLRVVEVAFRDGAAYPVTGGFSMRQLLPTAVIRGLLTLERRIPQWLWRIAALRMVIVLEKSGVAPGATTVAEPGL